MDVAVHAICRGGPASLEDYNNTVVGGAGSSNGYRLIFHQDPGNLWSFITGRVQERDRGSCRTLQVPIKTWRNAEHVRATLARASQAELAVARQAPHGPCSHPAK